MPCSATGSAAAAQRPRTCPLPRRRPRCTLPAGPVASTSCQWRCAWRVQAALRRPRRCWQEDWVTPEAGAANGCLLRRLQQSRRPHSAVCAGCSGCLPPWCQPLPRERAEPMLTLPGQGHGAGPVWGGQQQPLRRVHAGAGLFHTSSAPARQAGARLTTSAAHAISTRQFRAVARRLPHASLDSTRRTANKNAPPTTPPRSTAAIAR